MIFKNQFSKYITEPEAKKLASVMPDPMINMRPNVVPTAPDPIKAAVSPSMTAGLGTICNEEIRVPDKMVGLSKFEFILQNENELMTNIISKYLYIVSIL